MKVKLGPKILKFTKKDMRENKKALPPGTLRMASCPMRRIWIGSIDG